MSSCPSENSSATLLISTAVNDDLEFLAVGLSKKFLLKSDVVLTHSKSRSDWVGGVSRRLLAKSASSKLQVINVFLIIIFSLKCFFWGRIERVVITSPSPANILCVPLFWFLGKYIVVAVHDVQPHYDGFRGWLYSIQNEVIFRFASRVIVYSRYSEKMLQELFPKYVGCVDVEFLRSPVEDVICSSIVPFCDREFDFVWWGRAEKYKGIDRLPDIVRGIESIGKKMLVIGDFSAWPNIANTLRASHAVTLVDKKLANKKLAETLAVCKVNLCPYESATQSGVIPYCAALGVASLVSDVGALLEQVIELQCGRCSDFSGSDLANFLDSIDGEYLSSVNRHYFLLSGE